METNRDKLREPLRKHIDYKKGEALRKNYTK